MLTSYTICRHIPAQEPLPQGSQEITITVEPSLLIIFTSRVEKIIKDWLLNVYDL